MSIQNKIYNAFTSTTNKIEGGLAGLSAKINSFVSGSTASIGALWDGSVVGMNTANISLLSTEIENFIGRLEAIVATFNEQTPLDGAVKGQAQDAARAYVNAIKTMLTAYSESYRAFIDRLNVALENMAAGDKGNADAIQDDADSIQNDAQKTIDDVSDIKLKEDIEGITVG